MLTLFPEIFPGPLGVSLSGQALSRGLWRLETLDIRAFAVCSDVRVGRRSGGDDADQLPVDLTEPASTSPEKLLARFTSGHTADRMRVVFCTYQSIATRR